MKKKNVLITLTVLIIAGIIIVFWYFSQPLPSQLRQANDDIGDEAAKEQIRK